MLALVLVGLYAGAPHLVDSFGISAGDFAAAVKSWQKLKSSVANFYKCTLKMQRSVVALEKVADVLNRCETLSRFPLTNAISLMQHDDLPRQAPKIATKIGSHSPMIGMEKRSIIMITKIDPT